jgi:hypothetical protein
MEESQRAIPLHGTGYSIRRLSSVRPLQVTEEEWTIWHGREFAGTLPYLPNEPTDALVARSRAWLASLLA